MSQSDLRTLLQDAAEIQLVASLVSERVQKAEADTVEAKSRRCRGCNTNLCGSFVPSASHRINVPSGSGLRGKIRRVQASVPLSANGFQDLCSLTLRLQHQDNCFTLYKLQPLRGVRAFTKRTRV